jgi:hypothetical protein
MGWSAPLVMGLQAGSSIGGLIEGLSVGSLLGASVGALVGSLGCCWVVDFEALDVGYSCWQPQYPHHHRRWLLGSGMGCCCVCGAGGLTALFG